MAQWGDKPIKNGILLRLKINTALPPALKLTFMRGRGNFSRGCKEHTSQLVETGTHRAVGLGGEMRPEECSVACDDVYIRPLGAITFISIPLSPVVYCLSAPDTYEASLYGTGWPFEMTPHTLNSKQC